MGWRDLVDRARTAGARVTDDVLRRASPHVRLGARRVFVSDAALHGSITMLARARAPELALVLEGRPEGHLLRVNAGGKPLSALLVLQRVRLAGGRVRLELDTPEGITLEARPLAAFFATSVARLFGGTGAARAVFSLGTPEGLTWDGHRAVYEAPLDGVSFLGVRVGELDLDAAVTRASDGVWLVFDRDGVARDVAGVLFRSTLERFAGNRGE